MNTKMTPAQIAEAYSRFVGNPCVYVGGGRIMVRNTRTASMCCRYVTTREAAASIARRAA